MTWLLIAGCIGAVILLIGRRVWANKRAARERLEGYARHRAELEAHLDKLKLEATLAGYRGEAGLAIDWDKREIVLVIRDRAAEEQRDAAREGKVPTHSPYLFATRRIAGADVLRFAIIEDHYLKTNKTGGKRKHKYRRIELKLNIADRFAPVAVILVFFGDSLASDPTVIAARDNALFWEGMLYVLKHQASVAPSVDEQLEALTKRKHRGELSDAEYRREHARLKAAKILGYSVAQPRAVSP